MRGVGLNGDKAPPTAITFDETGFKRLGEDDGAQVWGTPEGDELALSHQARPPEPGPDLSNLEGLRAFYRREMRKVGRGVIEIDVVAVDGCDAVRLVFKAVQQPTGRTYVGGLALALRGVDYLFKVECKERGTIGIRDTFVLNDLLASGEVRIDSSSNRLIGWLDDPYDWFEEGPMTRNKSERVEYDARFPDHPLSRARRLLSHLERTVAIDESMKARPAR